MKNVLLDNKKTFSGWAIIIANNIINPIRNNIERLKKLKEIVFDFLFFVLKGIIGGDIVCNNNKYRFTTINPQMIPTGKLIQKAPSNMEYTKNDALKKQPMKISNTKKPRNANLSRIR